MSVKDLLQKRIIEPIMAQCPPSISRDVFLRFTFHTHRRTISQYKVVQDAKIPGLYCVNGCQPTQGIGDEYRNVWTRTRVWVRHDADDKYVHVEHRGHVFQLDEPTWITFKEKLKLRIDNQEI